jgi:hypothetical protein
MASEIYDNLSLKKADHLDARLAPVATAAALPAPTSTFLYEGATIYVKGEKENYRLERDSNNVLVWVKGSTKTRGNSPVLDRGVINIAPTTTILDLSLVAPPIASCESVTINISGSGTTASINSITNFPDGAELIFYAEVGKSIKFVHTDFISATANKIVLEHGYDLEIVGRSNANDALILERSYNKATNTYSDVLIQRGATQFVNSTEWQQTVIQVAVEDNLTSNATNRALSANQGNILNTTKQSKLTSVTPDRLTITDTSTTSSSIAILPYNKNYISIAWNSTLVTQAYASGIRSVLTGLSITDITQQDRYTIANLGTQDFNFNNGQAAVNFGTWMLPAGLSKNTSSNWFPIDLPKSDLYYQFKMPSRSNIAISTKTFPLFFSTESTDDTWLASTGNLNTVVDYDLLIQNFAYSFRPKYVTLNDAYEIRLKLKLRNNSITHQNIWVDLLQLNNGLATSNDVLPNNATPSNGVILTTSYAPYNGRPSVIDQGGSNFEIDLVWPVKFKTLPTPIPSFMFTLNAQNTGFGGAPNVAAPIVVDSGIIIMKKI